MLSRQCCLAVLTTAALAAPAAAQFRVLPSAGGAAPYYASYASAYAAPYSYPAYGYGYSPYGYGADPYGGYLNGAASVVNAEGQFAIASQQAYLMKEQVRAAQMDNKRKAFNEWLYERDHMPTLNDERMRVQQQEAERARNQPPPTEIWSGKSLNDLLGNIKQAQARGYSGPDVPLSADVLKQINLTPTSQGNVGLLKEAGNLNWPYGLQTVPPDDETKALRKQIDTLLLSGKEQAAAGRVDAKTITSLSDAIKRYRSLLVANVQDMSFTDYTAAKRYLASLDDAVAVLKSPNARQYADGQYAAKGKTVKELIAYMDDKGLTFAPAVHGEEAAYNALYNALLTYDIQTSALVASPGSTYPPTKQ